MVSSGRPLRLPLLASHAPYRASGRSIVTRGKGCSTMAILRSEDRDFSTTFRVASTGVRPLTRKRDPMSLIRRRVFAMHARRRRALSSLWPRIGGVPGRAGRRRCAPRGAKVFSLRLADTSMRSFRSDARPIGSGRAASTKKRLPRRNCGFHETKRGTSASQRRFVKTTVDVSIREERADEHTEAGAGLDPDVGSPRRGRRRRADPQRGSAFEACSLARARRLR